MSKVVAKIKELVKDIYDFTIDALVFVVWTGPLAVVEKVMGLLGIKDEEFIVVQKSTQPMLDSGGEDLVYTARKKAVLSTVSQGSTVANWYVAHISQSQTSMRQYYELAKSGGYINGLPFMEVRGGDIDYAAITSAVDSSTGLTTTRLTVNTVTPSDEIYFKDQLQASPYFYKPWSNLLTFTDPWGVSRADYGVDSITFNVSSGLHTIAISRTAQEAVFWIEGDYTITEGGTANYVIKCNRTVPVGKSVAISIAYSGTVLSRRYVKVPTVVMLGGTSEIAFSVAHDEDPFVSASSYITVILSDVDNWLGTFEAVTISTVNYVNTYVTDNDTKRLTVESIAVAEGAGSVTIPVKLEKATGGSFTVDYGMLGGTADAGLDYDGTPGTITFAGTEGETQNVVIPILTDAINEYSEYFTLNFTASTDGTVDISVTCRVTITDGSLLFSTPKSISIPGTIIRQGYIKEPSVIVTYHETANPSTEWFYWIYKYSSGTYPALKDSATVLSDLDMLPVAILKDASGAVTDDITSQDYKTTKVLLATIGVDIDDVVEGLKADTNYALITDIYINFALPTNLYTDIVSKGLWLSFYNLIVTNGLSSSTEEFIITFKESAINNAITWTTQTYTQGISGTISNGLLHNHSIVIILEEGYTDSDGDYIITQEAESTLTLEFQATPTTYDTIALVNLNNLSTIRKGQFSDVVISTLGDDALTVPVSYFVLNQFDTVEQMAVYEHIARLDTYAAQKIELDWYETRKFASLFQFVSIVLTIVSLGQASGVLAVLRQILFQYAVKRLVEEIAIRTGNPELAALLGLVALIAGSDYAGVALDFTSAEGLINASTNFADLFTTAYDVDTAAIQQEMAETNRNAERIIQENKDSFEGSPAMSSEFMVALNSIDTGVYPAVKAQYDFDILFDYDRLITNYYDNTFRTGVS